MLTREEPLRSRRPALLIAAHGERRPGAGNAGLERLVRALAERRVADEVAFGLIAGRPSVADGLASLRADAVLVYPLFLSLGWFARVRLPQLLAQALRLRGRQLEVLDPLGLDPGLADLVASRAAAAARERGLAAAATTLVLFAHGSPDDGASKAAAEDLAQRIAARHEFRGVRTALLEGAPGFAEAVGGNEGPVIVIGLFAGEGLHGAGDVPDLVRSSKGASFAGNVGSWPEIDDLVAAAVTRAMARPPRATIV